MTSAFVQGVQWVPGLPDHLVTWSTDLKLFKLTVLPATTKSDKTLAVPCTHSNLQSELKSRLNEPPHYMKCVSVCPLQGRSGGDVRVAVGQASGRVTLLSFASAGASPAGRAIKEFGPKTGRPVNDLSWNHIAPDLLAAGYEKNRNDHCLLIFDTSRTLAPPAELPVPAGSAPKLSSKGGKDFLRATVEIGLGETCHSLSWFKDHPDTVVAGMNLKNLKIFDVRACESSSSVAGKASMSNFTRGVFGVCVDPWVPYRIASHYDDSVVIWDTRNFDKPIWTRTQAGKVAHLAWSTTRSGLLASVIEGSEDSLVLHDIQSWAVMTEDGEPAVTQRTVNVIPLEHPDPTVPIAEDLEVSERDVITSFAWHPTLDNCLVACRRDGRLAECHAMERISPSWSSQHFLVWPQAGTLRSYDKSMPLFTQVLDDISVTMQERAVHGCYTERRTLASLEPYLDKHILNAWQWLEECGKIMREDLSFRNQFPRQTTFPGVRTALGLDRVKSSQSSGSGFSLRSDITYRHWNSGATSPSGKKPNKVFRGTPRERALRLCGWGVEEADLKRFTASLQESGQHARAASIAVFCLDIKLALQILCSGGSDNNMFNIVAMALSGFNDEKSGSLWREMVSNTHSQMEDPYLRAMFSFLILMSSNGNSDQENFACVLEERHIKLTDKVAFGCLYLSDSKLVDFINGHWKRCRERGDLEGIFLSGAFGTDCVQLLQRYLDVTGDVQTASWMAVKCLPEEFMASAEVAKNWIQQYRDLLNCWSLWEARAEFDIQCHTSGATKKPMQQVYVSCNFCGKPVCQNLNGLPDVFTLSRVNGDSKKVTTALVPSGHRTSARFQACPGCRKPLPRCSVCLINMGSHSGLMLGSSHHLPDESSGYSGCKISPFSKFFTWCQSCRHGGHADHIVGWFRDHSECPVNGCTCRCVALDGEPQETEPFNIGRRNSASSGSSVVASQKE